MPAAEARPPRSRPPCGAILALTLSLLGIPAVGAAQVPNPTVTGPIGTAGLRGHALWDSWFDLSGIGYIEEEYFISGEARSSPLSTTTSPFTTRIIVTRPIDPDDFNGTVLFDWVNVTAQFENPVDILEAHEMLHREGYAYVHVSAQSAGICCTPLTPKAWDPVRYAALSHPGDGFSFDIFSQVVQAVKFPSLAQGLDPIGGLSVEVALASGQSQSAGRLDTYVRDWQASHGVLDGFLIHGGGSKIHDSPPPAPVLHLLSDFEASTVEPIPSASYRLWEIAGTAHSDFWIGYHQEAGQGPRATADAPKQPAAADDELHLVAGNYGEQPHPLHASCILAGAAMPMRYATSAAIHHLDTWVRTGVQPPLGPRYQFDAGMLARDQFGNALGGIRLPPIDVPVARYESTVCALGGKTVPFTEAQLQLLYPTHAHYACQMQQKTDAAVAAGFLLPEDAADLMTRVAAAANRWLVAGEPACGGCGNGVLDAPEACDDANTMNGDGCDAACAVETCFACSGEPSSCIPGVGATCDDGNACTVDDLCTLIGTCTGTVDSGASCDDGSACTENDACDADGNCTGSGPLSACSSPDVPGRASVRLVDEASPNDGRDSLAWHWLKGTTTKAQFENPTQSTGYTLCVFDGADRLLMANEVRAGAGWRETRSGFSYRDTTLSNDGIRRLLLREGTQRAKILVQGRGANLGMTNLEAGLGLPVTVQLTNGTTCWQASYQNGVQRNGAGRFRAKGS